MMNDGGSPRSIPLIHVDIVPQRQPQTRASARPSFLAASIKIRLLKASLVSRVSNDPQTELYVSVDTSDETSSPLHRGYLTNNDEASVHDPAKPNKSLPALLLPQNDITLPSTWPCLCYGYCSRAFWPRDGEEKRVRVHVTEDTTIHIVSQPSSLEENRLPPNLEEEVMANQNPETIRELSLRLKIMWRRKIQIGNTPDAIHRLNTRNERRSKFSESFRGSHTAMSSVAPTIDNFLGPTSWEEASLIVHSPEHGSGKSLLVQSLARRLEPKARLHVIRSGAILGKSGIAADAVVESTLHQAVYLAALEDRPVCIILDDLNALLTPPAPSLSGDAATPVLNAITAYLRVLTRSLRKGVFPYPTKNPLYNVCGDHGLVFAARICLVGVITCPDDGGKTPTGGGSEKRSILDYLEAGKYRLPALTASTRLMALQATMEREGVSLTEEAAETLPRLAASAVWARGSAFHRIAQCLPPNSCSVDDLHRALARVGQTSTGAATNVSFEASASNDLFGSVGGNAEAKLALRDSLSLELERRKKLASFGLTPPTGVMLYGPPGCGKTLLAKAVAKVLQSKSEPSVGGAFVSLSSSDIVHAEVGTGEKLLVSAFETARMNAPAVVFIDEFQALFTDRSSGGSSRFSSTLLSLLDDIRRWETADENAISSVSPVENDSPRIVVLAATNTPWMIDKAFLRPGRFDHVIHVGLPNATDRQNIFELLLSQMNTSFEALEELQSFAQRLALVTEGYSGADISVVCRTAAVDCLVADEQVLKKEHFVSALTQVQASSSPGLVAKISKWKY